MRNGQAADDEQMPSSPSKVEDLTSRIRLEFTHFFLAVGSELEQFELIGVPVGRSGGAQGTACGAHEDGCDAVGERVVAKGCDADEAFGDFEHTSCENGQFESVAQIDGDEVARGQDQRNEVL